MIARPPAPFRSRAPFYMIAELYTRHAPDLATPPRPIPHPCTITSRNLVPPCAAGRNYQLPRTLEKRGPFRSFLLAMGLRVHQRRVSTKEAPVSFGAQDNPLPIRTPEFP